MKGHMQKLYLQLQFDAETLDIANSLFAFVAIHSPPACLWFKTLPKERI